MEIELENLLKAFIEYRDLDSYLRRPIHKQNLMNCYNTYKKPKIKETKWTCPPCMDRIYNDTFAILKEKNKI